MGIQDLQGKKIAVLGYGMEGKAVTKYLIKHGVKPVLFDQKPLEAWEKPERQEMHTLGVDFVFGPDSFRQLGKFDVAFRSPGVRLAQVESKKLKVTSQTKFFFENCPAKIIGITGTKGKGTTSALIYKMLLGSTIKDKRSRIYLTGNIGKVQPLDFIDKLKTDDWVVYELSSFQLQDLNRSPHIGVVLMVTSEHLDYHLDNKEYVKAKEAIVKYQNENDIALINADFEASLEIGKLGKGKKLYFSSKKTLEKGCFVKNGAILIAGSDFRLPISDLQLRGQHNWENVCAAILAANAAGANKSSIINAIKNFTGLEHRLEFVSQKRGIKFYNDSFSTTPETAIAAIKSFVEPLIVILGGSSKNSDFTLLGKIISESKNIKSLILIGEEAKRIKAAIQAEKLEMLTGAKNMIEIFAQVKSVALPGDVVLLSPACASFGMFNDYKDRGNQFKIAVKNF